MNAQQLRALCLRDTDVQGAVCRCGDEQLYAACLEAFLDDTTMMELNNSIENEMWDNAFTAAHALKGLAGNMGFVPLMHATGQLIVLIRGGRISELNDEMKEIKSCYRDIIDAIKQFLEYQ